MKSAKKSYLLLAMIPLLLASQQQVHSSPIDDALSCIVGVAALGAAVGGLIGYGIYEASQPLSDKDELKRARNLLDRADRLHADLSRTFVAELSCIGYFGVSGDQLRREINRYNYKYPFLSVSKKLSQAISDIRSMTNSIVSKKSHLFKRKNDLRSSDAISFRKRSSYMDRYDSMIDQLATEQNYLQSLCSELEQLKETVIDLPEYYQERERREREKLAKKMEQNVKQLGKLERKIKRNLDELKRNNRRDDNYRTTDRPSVIIINN